MHRWCLLCALNLGLMALESEAARPWYERCVVAPVHLEQERAYAEVQGLLETVRRFDTRKTLAARLGRPASATRDRWMWLAADPSDPEANGDVLILHFEEGLPVRIETLATSRARLLREVAVP
ncbi:MAG: hypothetical protein PF961_05465 [Planctomycetota bacterium]|jgi:argininosuccinate synthase|nr:hypothetical protein [Planctomycetota bacterium]